MVPGARLYPLAPPLPVQSSLKPDHLLSAVARAYALQADGGRADIRSCGDVRPMLTQPESSEFNHPSSTLYFRVDDIHAARGVLVDRGVTFEDQPHLIAKLPDHELWMTLFCDPDRNLHGLMSEVR